MKKKYAPSRVAILAGAMFSLLLVQIALQASAYAATLRPARTTVLRQPRPEAGLPIRLRIPSIDVDAVIETVGLTPQGAMDVPKDPNNAGWYSPGARPGNKGSAVIAGHLDWYKGKTAVFQRLDELEKGDILSVETDDGRFQLFIVREIRTYHPNEYVPDVFSESRGRHLNLVTCGGVWDTIRNIYTERLVVFADAVERT